MSRKVAIVGVGFERSGKSAVPSWELFASAALQALKDAAMEKNQIQALHLGNVYSAFTEKQTNMSPLVLASIGLENHIPCVRYETACASASVAFHQGFLGILSGMYDIVMVGGTERLSAIPGTAVQEAMSSSME